MSGLSGDADEFEFYDAWIVKSFNLILEFNKEYSKFKPKDIFGEGVYEKIRHRKEDNDRFENCFKIGPNKDETEETFKLNKCYTKRVSFLFSDNDDDEEITCFSLLHNATCPECSSRRIHPLTFPQGKTLNFNAECETCSHNFKFKDVMIEVLAHHYSYEIMKSLVKDGVFPLKKGGSCKQLTFLSYENMCFYCGSKAEGIDLEYTEVCGIHDSCYHEYRLA